jgi:hypothetical protein
MAAGRRMEELCIEGFRLIERMLYVKRQLCENLIAPTCDHRSGDVLLSDAYSILLNKLVVDAILHDDPIVPL